LSNKNGKKFSSFFYGNAIVIYKKIRRERFFVWPVVRAQSAAFYVDPLGVTNNLQLFANTGERSYNSHKYKKAMFA